MVTRNIVTAGGCLILGLVSGFGAARFHQERPEPNHTDVAVHVRASNDKAHSSTTDASPFSVVTPVTRTERTRTDQQSNMSAYPLSSADNSNNDEGIDYSQLNDARHLLETLHRIFQADAHRVGQWIAQAPNLPESNSTQLSINQALFQRLVEIDSNAFIEWMEQRIDTRESYTDTMLQAAITSYLMEQPGAARAWLTQLQTDDIQHSLDYAINASLGIVDPQSALESFAYGDERGYSYTIATQWAQNNPQEALSWIADQASTEQRMMYESIVLENLMRHDPQAALAYIQKQPSSSENEWLLSQYAITRAQSDPVGALDWASEQNDPQILEQTLSELAWSWPESELPALRTRIESIQDEQLRHRIIINTAGRFLDSLSQSDPASLMIWVDSQPSSVQGSIRPQAFGLWANSEPTSALEWIKQQPASNNRALMLESIAWELPELDLNLAIASFPSFNRNTQMNMIGSLMAAIRENRPAYLEQWVGQLENPDTREMASRLIDDYEQLSDPDSFIATLDQAVGEERARKLAILFRSSGMLDSTAFEQWMMENPLTPEDELLLQQLESNMLPGFGGQC